jgi:hypothetical protein
VRGVSRRSAARWDPAIGPVPLAFVALAGAALGTTWDLLHVVTGTTAYSIGPDRLPLWVPLEFALVYLVGVLGISVLGSPRADERSPARVAGEAGWVTIVYATTAVLHRFEWLVVFLALGGLVLRRRAYVEIVRRNLLPALALVIGGCAVESILIARGVFDYANASLGNIPLWLPLLYATAIPFAVRMTETAVWFSRTAERRPA